MEKEDALLEANRATAISQYCCTDVPFLAYGGSGSRLEGPLIAWLKLILKGHEHPPKQAWHAAAPPRAVLLRCCVVASQLISGFVYVY